jgi:hypothetical protein
VRSHDRSGFSGQGRHGRAAPIDPSAASCSEPTQHGDSQRQPDLSMASIGTTKTISWIAEMGTPTSSNIIMVDNKRMERRNATILYRFGSNGIHQWPFRQARKWNQPTMHLRSGRSVGKSSGEREGDRRKHKAALQNARQIACGFTHCIDQFACARDAACAP